MAKPSASKKPSSSSKRAPAARPGTRSPPDPAGNPSRTLSSAPSSSSQDRAPSATVEAPTPPGGSLLRLERPFDIDEFCQQLGETKITATVPREQLSEVLKRVVEFMEFGIYVYAVVVLPSPSATLEKFQVSLDRIDFDPQRKGWTPFHEKGRSDSPFGPTGKGPTNRAAPH
jgi:hypothetical protein